MPEQRKGGPNIVDAAKSASSSLPDVNAETYPYDYVQYLLDQSADFSLFAVPDPHYAETATLTPHDPQDFFGLNGGYGLALRSVLHRFDSLAHTSDAETGLKVEQAVGESAGTFRCLCLFGAGDSAWTPGKNPPPAIYDPWRSQRFSMLDCEVSFEGTDFFRGYGIGRTSPVMVQGRPQVLVGGVGNIMEGFGKFNGLKGTFVFTGTLTRELGFIGNLNCRVVDPEGKLRTEREIGSLTAINDLDPDDTFILLRGIKKDRTVKTTYGPPPGGNLVSLITPSQMRSVQNSFTNRGGGLRAERSVGQVMGEMEADVFFDLLAPPGTDQAPVPFTTRELYTFRDGRGRPVGTITAGVVEGVSFDLRFPSAPEQPGVRFAGFGPITGGTGPFEGVQGMLTVNSLIGIAPHALSLLHVLHIADTDGRFRAERQVGTRSS